MNQYDYILYFKERFIRNGFLFLISWILCSYHLALGATADVDRLDSSTGCPDQLISIPFINTNRNVIIDGSKARFKEKYYPDIGNLQRHLEYLSTLKYVNGVTRFMVRLVLIANEGQLDLLKSTFTVNVNRQFSMSGKTYTETYEEKYTFFDMFNTASLKIGAIAEHPNCLKVLRYMRLAIMEAFSETFLDFVNGRALFYGDGSVVSVNGKQSFLGKENDTQRRPFFNALIRDLANIEGDINREARKHEEVARDTMMPFRERGDMTDINVRTQDLILSRVLADRIFNNGYERDHFRNSMLNGRISQAVNAFRENGRVLSSYNDE